MRPTRQNIARSRWLEARGIATVYSMHGDIIAESLRARAARHAADKARARAYTAGRP